MPIEIDRVESRYRRAAGRWVKYADGKAYEFTFDELGIGPENTRQIYNSAYMWAKRHGLRVTMHTDAERKIFQVQFVREESSGT